VGNLPQQLAALNQANVTVQLLAAEAAVTGDPELAFAACAMDPLTSATLSLKETRDMVIELFEAEAKWLPQFKGNKPKKIEIIDVPENTVGVEVPLDPALAVANRFGKLAKD